MKRVLLLVSVVLAACSRGDAARPDVTRTDSVGVRIVTSTAADTALTWSFEEMDVLRDTLGEPYLFERLWGRDVLVDRAGRVYVLTRDPAILRFGRDGSFERVIGRDGNGPGEMRLPAVLAVNADTLVVLDFSKRALVRWAPSLDPVGDRRLEGALERADEIAFRTGGLWFQQNVYSDSGLVTQFHADTVGPPLHSIFTPRGGPVKFTCISLSRSSPLFTPRLAWSASGPRVIVNQGSEYSLWLYEGARPVASIRRRLTSRAPTLDDVRVMYPEGYKVSFGDERPPCITPAEEVMKGFGVAPVMPALWDLALLPDGTVWVLRTPAAAREPVIDVFSPDGAYVGTKRGMNLPIGMLPNGLILIPRMDEASGGVVLGRVRMAR